MKISELIVVLKRELGKYGDIEVYADQDYGQREIEEDSDPLCQSPSYEKSTDNMPERIVL